MNILHARPIVAALFVLSLITAPAAQSRRNLQGFTASGSEAQRKLEERFDATLSATDLDAWLKRLSARPHHIGSAYNKENADFIAAQFKSWGFDTRLERFDVLFPTPKTRLVEMTAPEKFSLKLAEPKLSDDATSGQQAEQLPVYNAYSIDGDVTGPLVFVNYGVPADYEELAKRGIDVKGKIVIAKYGGSWRGIKPKVAAEHGAIGCLIYSDPRNDGYYQGDVYPKGPWRSENGAQRGSVMDMPVFPGDPLTKNVGATPDAKRIDRKDAVTITKIPVLPISYADALPLLRQLDGDVVPESWRGALPITYHFGGTSPTVRIKLEFNWNTTPIYNVIATMRGSELPDQWIIRGNHRDAWANGAADPLSGLVALMQEARGIGELAKTGWRPKRTIVFAAWDGEEQGLLGSTEWVETHADELRKKAVVYINSDSNGRGFLSMGGSHTLERFINGVARDVPDPQTGISVWDRAKAYDIVNGSAAMRNEVMSRADLRIDPLGSGSDYTPFLQHLGIASLDIGFGGEGSGGSYHSIYDSYDHYRRFVDPGMKYGVALSKVGGRAVLRMANADSLPFEFVNLADTVEKYSKEVMALADSMRQDTVMRNGWIASGTLKAVQDPTKTFVLPTPQPEVPTFDFTPLTAAVEHLKKSSAAFKGSLGDRDIFLMGAERLLTRDEGLPRRDWFRHQIYAPGFYTGYGVKTLPGIREAIEQRNWNEAREQIKLTAAAIERLASAMDAAR